MNMLAIAQRHQGRGVGEQTVALIEYLRAMVVDKGRAGERFHAVFVDHRRAYLGDAPMGVGHSGGLVVRMRNVFANALSLNASGILVAHNHPSGHCRPSLLDVSATKRLVDVARALDIAVIDHLILTADAVYSMRAGGDL
ncbi:MAG: JAB domain-containing protein [Parvularcula sp.]|jgi:DNA repair protein RadC|nr:JAB domain-containing protein [Parvularcula sp.]